MTTKLTKLTYFNTLALDETREAHGLRVVIGKTTAAFDHTPAEIIAGIDKAINANPKSGHPRASLYAIRRKAVLAQVDEAAQ